MAYPETSTVEPKERQPSLPAELELHAGGPMETSAEPSVYALGALTLRYRRLVFGLPLLTALILVVGSLLWRRSYVSSTSFMPQATSNTPSRLLGGLAAQLGVAFPTGDPGQSPNFYADLLTSRDILQTVVETHYEFQSGGRTISGNLVELYNERGRTYEKRRDEAVKDLRDDIAVNTGLKTNVVELWVEARWAPLSQQIARRLLELVNEFNLKTRQSQAAAERRFVEGRLEQVRTDLREAEDQLQEFLQRNREFRNSPQLTFEYDRLQREVTMRQQVYTTLAQGYEQARIDEVRNTPLISIVEQPDLPVKPKSMRLILKTLLGLMLGGLLGVFLALWLEMVARDRVRSPEQFGRFSALRAETAQDFGAFQGRLRRAFRSGRPEDS